MSLAPITRHALARYTHAVEPNKRTGKLHPIMFDDKSREFLKAPRTARIATNDVKGYPHIVPLWFMLINDEIVMISERATRKITNLNADPRAAVEVGGDPLGYLIRGDVTIADDTDHEWTNRLTYHYESKEEADKHVVEWASLDMVVLFLKPVSVVQVYSA